MPQLKRGKIWLWLIKQYKLRNPTNKYHPDLQLNVTYRDLIKQSTIHQHAILLDLGRTMPMHPNFNKTLGSGQSALFNILKAYSVMDREVGYCQGLSFIAGILLIHTFNEEEEAFEMLKFLLVDLNIREQYKHDMSGLHKHMYQFSRLLNEKCNEIYFHLEEHDIATSLWLAPWFLTLFSSTYQLGFVARVFDFLFHKGADYIFNVSLAILLTHKPILLMCDSFESIVEHLKVTIPEMSLIETERIINKSFSFELSALLNKYDIEFSILFEETSGVEEAMTSNTDRLNRLKLENKNLKVKLKNFSDTHKMNKLYNENQEDAMLNLYHENRKLKQMNKTLELEREVLLNKLTEQDKLLKVKFPDVNN